MAAKNEKKPEDTALSGKKDKPLEKLMEEHPEETMSQVENRYGNGRERPGSDGPHSKPFERNH